MTRSMGVRLSLSTQAAGHSVLIHCIAGAHRAGTTGCAYFMHATHCGRDEAIAHCQRQRDVVQPEISDRLMWILKRL